MTGPLEGRVVVVTRAADQADALAGPLRRLGASVLAAPAIEILPTAPGPLDDALRRAVAGGFAWIVLTSAAGVAAVAERLAIAPGDPLLVARRITHDAAGAPALYSEHRYPAVRTQFEIEFSLRTGALQHA